MPDSSPSDAPRDPICRGCGGALGETPNGSGFCDICLYAVGSRSVAEMMGEEDGEGVLLSEESGIRLLERLGEGSYGVVWRGRRPVGEGMEDVAVKVFQQRNGAMFERVDYVRFERSAQVLESLDHPSVVKVLNYCQSDEELPCLVMEYVRGETMESFLWAMTPHGNPEAGTLVVRLMEQMAEAAGYFHGKGVVHRDLKPGNVLVVPEGEDWRVVVIDFDLLCIPRDAESRQTRLTGTAQDIGTKLFMAPEQFTTGRGMDRGPEVGAATDVYAMGVMLCVFLTDNLPYGQVTPSIYMEKERRAARVKRCGHLPRPAALQAIVEKCLELDPRHRYRNGAELAADLRAWREGGTVRAQRWAGVARMRRRLWEHRTAAVVAGVAALGFWGTWNRASVAEAARGKADGFAAQAREQEGLTRKLYGGNLAGLAEQQLAQGKEAEALALYAEAVRLDPEDGPMVRRAQGVLFSTRAMVPLRGALRGVKGGRVGWTTYDRDGRALLMGGPEGVVLYSMGNLDEGRVLLEGDVLSGSFSPDGRWLALGLRGAGVVVYDWKAGKEAGRCGTGDFYALDWSGDSGLVVGVNGEKKAACFAWNAGEKAALMERWPGREAGGSNIWLNPTDGTRRVRFSRSGEHVISTMDSRSAAELLDAETGSPLRTLGLAPGQGAVSICLEVGREGWVTAGGGGYFIFWRQGVEEGIFASVPSQRTVTRGLSSAGSGRFVLCDMDGRLYFYATQAAGGPVLEEVRELGFSVKQILLDPEEDWLVALDETGAVTAWAGGLGRATEAPLRMRADAGNLTRIMLAPDGNTLAGITDRGDGVLWDLNAGKIVPTKAAQATSGVAFSGSGKELVGLSADGREVILWRADDLSELGRWPHGRERTELGNSMVPDTRRPAGYGGEKLSEFFWHQDRAGFLVWRSAAEAGREVSRSREPLGEILAAVLNPAGTVLAVVEAPRRVHLFSLDGSMLTPPPPALNADRIAWNAEGTRLALWAGGQLPFTMIHLTDPPVTARLELGGSATAMAFPPRGTETEEMLLTADDEHALSVWRLRETWRREIEYPVRAKVLRLLFRPAPDGLRVQLLLEDGGVEERLWWDLGRPIPKREPAAKAEVAGVAEANGLLAWLQEGRVHVIDGASGRTIFEHMNQDEVVSGLAFSPDGLRLAVAGGSTRTLDLPPASSPRAAEWLPPLLNYRGGLEYQQTEREYRAVNRRKVLDELTAISARGGHRVLDWFLRQGKTVSPYSKLTEAEESVRWFAPEAPRRLTGEQFATPWPVHRMLEKIEGMQRLVPDHVLSRLSTSGETVELTGIPALTDSALLLRVAEWLHTQARTEVALALLKRDAPQATAGLDPDARIRKCLRVMEAVATPGMEEATWWLAFDAGWMPEKSYQSMLTALAEAEGWQVEPPVWSESEGSKGGELRIRFEIKRKETLLRLRAGWDAGFKAGDWTMNGVRLDRKHVGSAPAAPGRVLQFVSTLAVKAGENEIRLSCEEKPSAAGLESFFMEPAEAPLLRLLAFRLVDGKAPVDCGEWQAAIDRGRAVIADYLKTLERGQQVIRNVLPPDSALFAAARLLKPEKDPDFFQFLDIMESYPMQAGVQVEYFEMAAANLRRTALAACKNGQALAVKEAMPRVKALAEKAAASNPPEAAPMQAIHKRLMEDLDRGIQAAEK